VAAVATQDGAIHTFELSTKKRSPVLQVGTGVSSVQLSPSGELAIARGQVVTVHKRDPEAGWSPQGVEVSPSDTLSRQITAMAFSNTGRRLLIADDGGDIGLWHVEVSTKAKHELMSLARHERSIHTLRFSGDGRTLMSSDRDQMVVWFSSGHELPNEKQAVAQ
jgi:WD40 repeat protein